MDRFIETIYKDILCVADKDGDIEKFIIHLKNGDTIAATGSKRLCQVGVESPFIIIEGVLNSDEEEHHYFVPKDNVNYLEIIKK